MQWKENCHFDEKCNSEKCCNDIMVTNEQCNNCLKRNDARCTDIIKMVTIWRKKWVRIGSVTIEEPGVFCSAVSINSILLQCIKHSLSISQRREGEIWKKQNCNWHIALLILHKKYSKVIFFLCDIADLKSKILCEEKIEETW